MQLFNGKQFGEQLLAAVRELIAATIAPVLRRVERIENMPPVLPIPGPQGAPGRDADLGIIRGWIEDRVAVLPKPKDGAPGAKGDPGEPGKNGESVDLIALKAQVAGWVKDAVALIPFPKEGPQGKDGKDADIGALHVWILKAVADATEVKLPLLVAAAVAALPKPKDGEDGKSVDENALIELIELNAIEQVSKQVAALPKAKDGRDGKDVNEAELFALIKLRVELEMEASRNALPIPKDGAPGKDADPVDLSAIHLFIVDAVAKAVAALPVPKDGRDGRDAVAKDGSPGRDAAEIDVLDGLDETRSYPRGTYVTFRGGMFRSTRATDALSAKQGDMKAAGWSVVLNGIAKEGEEISDDFRTIKRLTVFTDGTRVERMHYVPAVVYRSIYKPDVVYVRGDAVTSGNQYWIAECNPAVGERPGTSDAWRLAVRSGRDGKDATSNKGTAPPREPIKLR